MDILTKSERSHRMSLIRGRGNRTTELAMVKLLREVGAKGWRRHVTITLKAAKETKARKTRPDFVFLRQRVALFVDGCFWHGCPWHSPVSRHNSPYWREKISSNRVRDAKQRNRLRRSGWFVIAIWEHSLQDQNKAAVSRRILAALAKNHRES
jgi:DNA mismatch endonuclease (patch repair protein)